ncbi:MAG: lipopolysaccharide biosynthesis protein [Thermoleophilia bacterium]
MSEHRSLGARAARALIWQYGSTFGGRLMSLAVVAILARLLSPNDFGLVALATMFTALLDVVRDLGLGQALVIAKHEDDDAVANTVFRWGMLIGFCIWGLTIAISPLVAAFFHKPAVTPILIVLGTVFPLRALSLTHYSIAQKQLDFRSRTIAELINTGGRGVVGVALAFMGFGAWSLVLSFVAGTAMFTVALWVLVKWRPRWHAATVPVKSLLMFGGVLTMVDILAAVLYSVDVFVIGKMIGQEQLGLYSMATRLPELVVLNLSMSLGLVLFPAFAGLRVNELSGAFLKALRFTMFLSLPLAVGLVTLATPVTELLFGHKWLAPVDSMRVLWWAKHVLLRHRDPGQDGCTRPSGAPSCCCTWPSPRWRW